jgi:hypothetical protein
MQTVTRVPDGARQNTENQRRAVNQYGICVGSADPDAWFPPEPIRSGHDDADAVAARKASYEQTAKTLCAGCPVRNECLALALREEADLPPSWIHGVRGGTAPWERQNMRRNRQRAAARRAEQEVA